ncbi:MAG: hypothetical protein ABI091_24950, partial [Ferruginibacter sp.]
MKINLKNSGFLIIAIVLFTACKKNTSNEDGGGGMVPPGGGVDSTYSPVDPPVAVTVGFFQDAWKAKSFTAPAIVTGTL